MKRMHIHVAVNELTESINFYSTIFGASPTYLRDDYARWELTDPQLHFAISHRGHNTGINHLGIQVDSAEELGEITQRLNDADIAGSTQQDASCCYANSNKHWTLDPQGIAWESFHRLAETTTFGHDTETGTAACCIPLKNNLADTNELAPCCIPEEDNSSGCCL